MNKFDIRIDNIYLVVMTFSTLHVATQENDSGDDVGKIERDFLSQRCAIIHAARVIKIFAYSRDINVRRGFYTLRKVGA